jgi:hypothetical protein
MGTIFAAFRARTIWPSMVILAACLAVALNSLKVQVPPL